MAFPQLQKGLGANPAMGPLLAGFQGKPSETTRLRVLNETVHIRAFSNQFVYNKWETPC